MRRYVLCIFFLIADALASPVRPADCVDTNGKPLPASEYRALTLLISRDSNQSVFLSWRMLGKDTKNTSYDIFSIIDGKKITRVNKDPVSNRTNFVDTTTCSLPSNCDQAEWFIRINQIPPSESSCSEKSKLPPGPDKDKVIINTGLDVFGRRFGFGDLNGDGRFEYVLRYPGNDVDPYFRIWRPSSGTYKLRAFNSQGNVLWDYDMGNAIEMGIWYSPYLLYDLDRDGKSELIVKAGDAVPDSAIKDASGRVVQGKEYLRVISGVDGKTTLAQADWPSREGFAGKTSQPYGVYNHYSRNQLAIAYLDGKNPYVIVARGTYGKQKIHAYKFDSKNGLQQLWAFENQNPHSCEECSPESTQQRRTLWGQGAHTIRIGDLDSDGLDEVVIGSFALDNDGKILWSIDKGDLDHIHLGDLDTTTPGLEIYYGAERAAKQSGMGMIRAATGEYLWAHKEPTSHIHKEGLCADLLREPPGVECFSGESDRSKYWLWSSQGKVINNENLGGATLSPKAVYWKDGPEKLLIKPLSKSGTGNYAELLDLNTDQQVDILQLPSSMPKNEHQYFEALAYMDILGDWREEIIGVARGQLVIYVSRLPSTHRLPWLTLDPTYGRNAILSSMGYYQQPLLGYDPCAAYSVCPQISTGTPK